MRLLLDENIAVPLEAALCERGYSADHVITLDWQGKQDRELLDLAQEHGYDVLVTMDQHRGDARLISLAAMQAGLRKVLLTFSRSINETPDAQIQLVLDNIQEIAKVAVPDSKGRKVTLSAATGTVLKCQTITIVEAELKRHGLDIAPTTAV